MGLPTWALALISVLLVLTAGAIGWRYWRRRPTAEELERLRRLGVNKKGKLGDGEIVDVDGVSIVYSYSVAGVIYTTTQDATSLQEDLPVDRMTMVGPVMIKFDPRNPANSIVLCEEWSGLRARQSGIPKRPANV
ncbi:MAG TPA: hypothetical protein VK789_28585 [Bryobacteraceae bacterium]|nr:hypothetical protein [Bryobacteraceae bacterium]